MSLYKMSNLEKIYGTPYIDKKAPGYYPIEINRKTNFIVDAALNFLKERLSIDAVIKEFSFATVAMVTYVFMQNSGRIKSLGGFGYLIGLTLISAIIYNLFKASIKSLAPGLICLVVGLVLLSSNMHHQYLKFLSNDMLNSIIGIGAFFIALSLFKSNTN